MSRLSDKPNEPMGTCDYPGGKIPHTERRCLSPADWKPLPTAPVDAPPSDTSLLCADCKHPKNDSRFHLEAPGDNWGAALHHFVPAAPPQDVRPSKLDELNRAFRCLYLECPAAVVDNLKRRFDEYLAEVLAAAERPAPAQEDLERARKLVYEMGICSTSGHMARMIAKEYAADCAFRRAAQAERQVVGADEIIEKCAGQIPMPNPFAKDHDANKRHRENIRALKGTFSLPAERQVAGAGKFTVTFRPYPAGAGSRVHDESWTIEGNSLRDALDKFYCKPEFNSEWRVVDVALPAERVSRELAKLIAKWRNAAIDSREESGRIRRTVHVATYAEANCMVRAEVWCVCAD